MPSLSAYHLTWVSLTLDVGYLFKTAPAKHILFWWGGSKITADGDCSHEIKRRLLVGHEEIPLVQGKEQWLHFAGAAMKRYLMSKLEIQVRR